MYICGRFRFFARVTFEKQIILLIPTRYDDNIFSDILNADKAKGLRFCTLSLKPGSHYRLCDFCLSSGIAVETTKDVKSQPSFVDFTNATVGPIRSVQLLLNQSERSFDQRRIV